MQTNLKQTLNHKQTFIISNKLMHSLHILEIPSFELEKLIQKEIESNPLIDWAPSRIPLVELHFETSATPTNPLDDLYFQLHVSKLDQTIGTYIIESLDQNGYLTVSNKEIAKACNCSIKLVQSTLSSIQQFEPKGIATRSLKECLLVQLNKNDPNYKLLKKSLNHLDAFASGSFNQLSTTLNISKDKVIELFKTIQTLNPKPLTPSKDPMILFPDIKIELIDDQLHFIPYQFEESFVIQKDLSNYPKETQNYLKNYLKEALALQTTCKKRTATLCKVVSTILTIQNDYFFGKPLKPMILEDIAKECDLHISTVHRCLMHKSYEFNGHLYPFQTLFSYEVHNNCSKAAIIQHLKSLIDNEDSTNPYSDQELTHMINKDLNIDISRRTTTKYRNQLRILSSTKRKQLNQDHSL